MSKPDASARTHVAALMENPVGSSEAAAASNNNDEEEDDECECLCTAAQPSRPLRKNVVCYFRAERERDSQMTDAPSRGSSLNMTS